MNTTTNFFVLVFLAIVACGGDGPVEPRRDSPDPPDPPPAPSVASLELTLSSTGTEGLGDTVPVSLTARDEHGTEIDVPSGTRLAILGAEPHFEGSVVARAVGTFPDLGLELSWPGRVEVQAVSGAIRSDAAVLDVVPQEPIVDRIEERVVEVAGEATLTGYRLDLLPPGSISAKGTSIALSLLDDDRARLVVPDLGVPTVGCDPRATVEVGVAGVRVFGRLPVLRYGAGRAITLAPGEFEMLAAPEAGCLSFPEGVAPDRAYTLLYVDARPIRESETVPEGWNEDWRFGTLDLSVEDRSVDAPMVPPAAEMVPAITRSARSIHEVRPLAFGSAGTVPADYLGFFTRPLVVGERVHVDGDVAFEYEAARVLRTYGPKEEVALLGLESEGASAALAGGRFAVDPYMDELAGELQVLARIYAGAFPSDYSTGQVIILLRNDRGGAPAFVAARAGQRPGASPQGYVVVQAGGTWSWSTGGTASSLHVLAHETAHLAQLSRDQEICDGSGGDACPWGTGGSWAVEGGADFAAHEVIRRARGFSLNGNVYPALRVAEHWGGAWAPAGPSVYAFGRGYGHAEWFMQDLVRRAVASGVPLDQALARVGRASYEPWYGWTSTQYFDPVDRTVKWRPPTRPVPGLVPRMRELFGPEWDPIEAFLLAAATQVVDDRTENPVLQDQTHGHRYELYEGPFATIRLGSGEGLNFTTGSWTFGWAEVQVPPAGGDLSFGSPQPDVHWILVRTR